MTQTIAVWPRSQRVQLPDRLGEPEGQSRFFD
jgi:hypothetical protein